MDYSNQLNGNKDPNKSYRDKKNKRNQKERESWLEKLFFRDLPNSLSMALYKFIQGEIDDLTDDLNRKQW